MLRLFCIFRFYPLKPLSFWTKLCYDGDITGNGSRNTHRYHDRRKRNMKKNPAARLLFIALLIGMLLLPVL
ncbi:MAG: hypothetical protein IJ343_04230, partial [Clostridia bacterium]|nr:hypothetical protein [Clostridia bacterium]